MPRRCPICKTKHDDLPLCFGIDAPWSAYVHERDFKRRVELTDDQCVIDGEHFFIRGHIELPIHDYSDALTFSVWSSLSEESFRHMTDRWNEPGREADLPYFGWLCSPISVYPDTIHLKLSVQSRAPGVTPLFTLEPTDHPLAIDQHNGISMDRWHIIAQQILHE